MSSNSHHAAPWGRALTVITLAVCALMILVTGLIWQSPPRAGIARVLGCGVPILALLIAALYSVRGYSVEGRELRVPRLLWTTHIPLDGLQSVEADPTATRGSLRLMGNGGFFAFSGWHVNRRLGRYRLFATDMARSVVLTFAHRRPVVVTPADPEAFVREVRAAVGLVRR